MNGPGMYGGWMDIIEGEDIIHPHSSSIHPPVSGAVPHGGWMDHGYRTRILFIPHSFPFIGLGMINAWGKSWSPLISIHLLCPSCEAGDGLFKFDCFSFFSLLRVLKLDSALLWSLIFTSRGNLYRAQIGVDLDLEHCAMYLSITQHT